MLGIKSSPMHSIIWLPSSIPILRIDNVIGSKAYILELGFVSFILFPTPLNVPPVPIPETNPLISDCESMISFPVVLYLASTFNSLPN